MSRYAPILLVCLLASTSLQADDTFPPLDQRLGKTITVVEKNLPAEKAVITQVWRLSDGTPVMQAETVSTKVAMTLVENTKAKSAAERIKVYRWVNGVRPEGCPAAPVMKAAAPVKQTNTTIVQTQAPVTKSASPVVHATVVTKPVVTRPEKVVAMDGGLVPVLPKKEEVKTVTTVAANTPVVAAATKKSDLPLLPPNANTRPVVTTTVPTPAPAVTKTAPAVIKTAPAVSMPVVQSTPVQAPAPVHAAPIAPHQRELVGGCEVITVTENGIARKYKVLGSARDKHGAMTYRAQALDNNEVVTLNCDNCGVAACAPAPVKCEPAKVVCAPAPVKCEPAKVACAPVAPVCPAPVKCEPAKVVACEPVKACDPCATKGCNPCDNNVCKTDDCRACKTCGGPEGSCDECSTRGRRERGHGHGRRVRVREDEINVPVPGVRLNAWNGTPSGPPPQPLVPAFCTMNSSSVRAYMCAPNIVPFACLHQPFGDNCNAQIMAGIYTKNGENGEAVANTLHLMNVLAQSQEWENRQWAASRLQQATLPTVRPYVEDSLVAAVQFDRAPLVKVAAIRTLASLKSTRPDVLSMLNYASSDPDPRIKEAASEAMNMLMKQAGIQQAGYVK